MLLLKESEGELLEGALELRGVLGGLFTLVGFFEGILLEELLGGELLEGRLVLGGVLGGLLILAGFFEGASLEVLVLGGLEGGLLSGLLEEILGGLLRGLLEELLGGLEEGLEESGVELLTVMEGRGTEFRTVIVIGAGEEVLAFRSDEAVEMEVIGVEERVGLLVVVTVVVAVVVVVAAVVAVGEV
jgi:hypothetical protein